MIISLISLSRNTVFLSNKSYIYQFLNPYVYPLFYCSGPFLYLYVKKSFANDLEQALKPLEYLYFLPVILVFINFSPQYFLSSEDHAAYYREIKLNCLTWFLCPKMNRRFYSMPSQIHFWIS